MLMPPAPAIYSHTNRPVLIWLTVPLVLGALYVKLPIHSPPSNGLPLLLMGLWLLAMTAGWGRQPAIGSPGYAVTRYLSGALVSANAMLLLDVRPTETLYGDIAGSAGSAWLGYLMEIIFLSGTVGVFARTGALVAKVDQQEKRLRGAREQILMLKLAPHFIFNTLNVLKAQIELEPRAASATTDQLAALFRRLLERSKSSTAPLREELAFVEAYLGIERSRLGDRLRVRVEVPEAVESLEVPTFALQVLVENAVKHGIAPLEEGGEIRIWATAEEFFGTHMIRIGVDNTYGEGSEGGLGIGLESLRAQLSHPDEFLKTRAKDGMFRVEFRCLREREHVLPYQEATA